nr:reverse transcriptase domain-containing protein [Tanacetum cinerariifolium]
MPSFDSILRASASLGNDLGSQGCAALRKKFKEDLFTSAIKHGIILDSSEPSNDNSNVVNAPREPFVVNQDPDKISSQSPPQINHHCCYGCGDPLEGIFCHQCTCKLCGNGAHYGYNCPPKVQIIPDPEPFNNQTIKELPPTVQSFDPKPDLVHKSPNNCPKCGNPVKGHYSQGCAALRKKFKEDLFASAIKHGIIQDSSEPSNDNSNVVNAPREPFVKASRRVGTDITGNWPKESYREADLIIQFKLSSVSSSKLSRDQTSNPTSSTNPTPKGPIRRSSKQKVENSNFEENLPPEVPMADNRTMAQLLQAPTEGYEDAIVIPEIAATNFELKHGLINLVQNKQFFGHDKEDSHAHIRYFNKITSTMRVPNVPNSTIKLMLFQFSLEGAARIWLEKEPPRSILTWDDLVSKFINQFFPPSKTTNLRNEITRFQQRFDESFSEAWDHFNDLLRACPHHGFSELHKLDTSYNALNVNDQDSLNSAAVIAKVNTSSSTPAISSNVAELKDMVRALLLDKKNQYSAPALSPTPAPVKVVEPNCVTCGGSGTLPGNTITNPKEDLKGITTRSGVAYQGPTIPTPSKVVKQGTETQTLVSEPIVAPVSALMPNLKLPIPYPSRRDNERRRDQANEQIEKLYEIFKDMKKLSEMARTPMNEHCSEVILNKLPRKLGDPGKFLIPCEFPGMDECLALADLGRALIDVHKGELTLRIGNEAITYNLDQTSRYSANYDQMTANKIDVTNMACEEYSQEVLGFFDVTANFLLFEEAGAFLGLEDDPNSPEFNPFYYDLEGEILLLEAILNSKPSPLLPNHEQNMPSFKKELNACKANTVKSSIDEPPEVELKDLPSHLEYAFLEGDNKLPVIIAKELGDEEKSALLKVLNSHKRAIAWKLSDIQGINPKFCTHKILLEEDYKPTVQHQRRVNPKIHDVIKKEVEKLLDAGLIYPISDSPWVSPVHCVPKKGGFTVVENEENELIPTRLVTGWWVCIDYRKLKEATCKDHFPLPFMDQMLERLAGNEYYCFLDGFFGYFQILIDPRDQEKTTFTCPYETFAYRRMPFSLCNAPGTFRR